MDISTDIGALELSNRTANILKSARISSVSQLLQQENLDRLFKSDGFGKKCAADLISGLMFFYGKALSDLDKTYALNHNEVDGMDEIVDKAKRYDRLRDAMGENLYCILERAAGHMQGIRGCLADMVNSL